MTVSNTHWGGLFKIAGISALILLIYSLVTMALLIAVGGTPETAREGFHLLAENRLTGLLRLDALTILLMPFYYPCFWGYTARCGVWMAKNRCKIQRAA